MIVGVVVLAVIAVVLGYQIYKQTTGAGIAPPVVQTPPVQQTQDTSVQPTQQQTTQQTLPSAEEQALVKAIPDPNSSLEEKIEYNKKLEKFEKVTDMVEITNCWPYPFIARVREDTDLKIKNNDSVDNIIFIGQKQINVPANTTVTTEPGKGDGITNLTCNGGAQGLLHVIQAQ